MSVNKVSSTDGSLTPIAKNTSNSLSYLSDVDITLPSTGQILQYDGSEWGNGQPAYQINDTAETNLADDDKIPFYDTSASNKRSSTWGNIKAKLKSYFDSLFDNIPTKNSNNPVKSGGVYDAVSANTQLISDTVGWVASKNLFDKDSPNIEKNYFLKSDGSTTSSNTWRISDYIKVIAGFKYTISSTGGGNSPSVCFYNANKEYISGIAYENNERKTFTIPANAVYLRYSVADSRMATSQCEMGDTVTTYEAYIPSVDAQKANNSVIAPVEDGTTCKNPNGYTAGQHFQHDGGFCTATTIIAYGETLTEGTNYTKGDIGSSYSNKNVYLTNIASIYDFVPNVNDHAIIFVNASTISTLTNGKVSSAGKITITRVNSTRFDWYGMLGANVFAMGQVNNSAYLSHKVIYQDTETAEATNPHEDITFNTNYKYAVKNGKTVNFNVRFTLANDIASGSNVRLFDLPYLPNLQYLKFIVYDTTADQYTTKFAFLANTNGRMYISKGLTAGGYEISGIYICQ